MTYAFQVAYGKLPGDTVDYRVLTNTLGSWSEREVEQAITRLNGGALKENDRVAPPPPWFTFGAARPDRGATQYMLAIRQDWSNYRDAPTNGARLIQMRSIIALPFHDHLAVPLTFRMLAEQVPLIDLAALRVNQQLDPIPLPEIPIPQLVAHRAALIETFGFERCAWLAARALSDPLALIRPQQSGATTQPPWPIAWTERLDWLEAIASLLPLGLRAEFAVNTWASKAKTDSLRVRFTATAEQDQELRWDNVGQSNFLSSTAQEYFELLISLRRRFEIAAIVHHLGERWQPMTFLSPLSVIEALADLDRPLVVLQRVRDGQASLKEVISLFAPTPPSVLVADEVDTLIKSLLNAGNADGLAVVANNWQDQYWSVVRKAVGRRLVDLVELSSIQPYVELAARIQQLSNFTSLLLEIAAEWFDHARAGDYRATDQLLKILITTPEFLPGTHSRQIMQLLESRPRFLVRLLLLLAIQVNSSEDSTVARQWFQALEQEALRTKNLVALASSVCGLSRVVARHETMSDIATIENDAPFFLVRVACVSAERDTSRLERLLPGLIEWYAFDVDDRGRNGSQVRNNLANFLRNLPVGATTSAFRARYDIMIILLNQGRHERLNFGVEIERSRSEFDAYLRELMALVSALSTSSFHLADAIAARAVTMSPKNQIAQDNLGRLLARLSQQDLDAGLRQKIAHMLPATASVWRDGSEPREMISQGPPGQLVSGFHSSTTPGDAARLAKECLGNGEMTVTDLMSYLDRCGFSKDALGWSQFLDELQQALRQQPVIENSGLVIRGLMEGAIRGNVNSALQKTYPQALKGQFLNSLLLIDVCGPIVTAELDLSDAEQEYVERVLNKAKKRFKRGGLF